jgi:hypothetical protein
MLQGGRSRQGVRIFFFLGFSSRPVDSFTFAPHHVLCAITLLFFPPIYASGLLGLTRRLALLCMSGIEPPSVWHIHLTGEAWLVKYTSTGS